MRGGEYMIDVTNTDSFNIRQHSSKDTRKDAGPAPFAKSLEVASKKANNRRETHGRTADDPVKGQGRKEWTHQRSRAESKSRTDDNLQNNSPDLAHPEQDQSVGAEYNLLMWFFDMPVELNELIDLPTEENTLISEETMKNILLWMQSMPEVDNLPEELTAITDKMKELLQAQKELSQISLSTDKKTEITTLLSQMNSIIEMISKEATSKESAAQEAVATLVAGGVADMNTLTETDTKYETTKQSEVAFLRAFSTGEGTPTEDLTKDFSDQHFSKKDFNPSDTSTEFIVQEQPNETVIPFSLAQIDTLLQQNTMLNELNQQHSQIQQEVLQQVIDKIQVTQGTDQSFVTLHLVPEHLGKLTIQLTSDLQQGMTARIYAETPHAKEMIESNFGQLKDALSGKGVNLTALEVFVGQDPESSEKQREFQYEQAKAQRRRGSRIDKASNTGQTAIINEMPMVNNPYVQTEGFDQLG